MSPSQSSGLSQKRFRYTKNKERAYTFSFTADSNIRQCDGLTWSPGKSQKEAQEDLGTLKKTVTPD
jgi:hypothetical protein